jgi:putative ABC transport system ATP-binding protein
MSKRPTRGGMGLEPVLAFRNLAKKTPDEHKLLFSGVTGEVFPGDRIAIMGVSGQGKSTLLLILARLAAADEGELFLHGVPASQIPGRQWRMKAGYVSQQAVMLPGSVEDNLRTASRLHRSVFDSTAAKTMMASLGLEHLVWHKPAQELSGGEKQRLALVRSLLLPYDVLLLDEVTASLDQSSKHAVEVLLDEWQKTTKAALIWVTHDQSQASRVGRRTWMMDNHRLTETTEIGAVH